MIRVQPGMVNVECEMKTSVSFKAPEITNCLMMYELARCDMATVYMTAPNTGVC